MSRSGTPYLTIAFVALLACGGSVATTDAGPDASAEAPDGLGPGWTQCKSPEGYLLCQGPSDCPTDATCGTCITSQNPQPNELGVCSSGVEPLTATQCAYAEDGDICAEDTFAGGFWATTFDYGVLLAMNGGTDRARYADMGKWTGDALPAPATCPTLTHATLCGGNCGGCGASEICHGRSPLHPYGICISKLGSDSCDAAHNKLCTDTNNKCFTYTIQADVQASAYSLCLPAASCDDLAANLPGGGTCQ
jgi:hypothetical protein